jgi:hypothetical protein
MPILCLLKLILLEFGNMHLVLCKLSLAHHTLMYHDNEAALILILDLFTRSQEQQRNLLDFDQEVAEEELETVRRLLVLNLVPLFLLDLFIATAHNGVFSD